MKLKKPSSTIHFPEVEKQVLAFWKKNRIFQRSIEEKNPNSRWSFYDGPPFATGLPHYGHLLAGTIKDVIPRYWAMRGKRVERRFGWDCHGLPVEFEMEGELGLKGRKSIIDYGVDRFNEACRGIVLRYTKEWKQTVERMGRWIDFENDYKTMDPEFMESVWAVFKRLWDRGLIYEDKKVLPYSARITTPLSNFEANLNYQEISDPSIWVKLELEKEPGTYLLIWTTTPWTLPANLAVAAHPDFPYVKVEHKKTGEKYILHETLAQDTFAPEGGKKAYKVLETFRGRDLKGWKYRPLIPSFPGKILPQHHVVLLGDFVTDDSGTGLVHIAPAYGEEDFQICREHEIEPLDHLDEEGTFTNDCPDFEGSNFKEADKKILSYLREKNLLLRQETVRHSYPFCYRSDTPLIYRAISTWFVNVTKIKDELLRNNQNIHWVPEHLKEGRFGKWLEGARDWAISRNRFWGNPMPIWRNEETGEALCIGSRAELEKLTGTQVPDLHKHFVDHLVIRSPKTGQELRRIPHVLDCWFESGSMPYAQHHYPFSMSEKDFRNIFPADFIGEGLDQTRGWFYTLLVLSTALEMGHPFRNVVVNGIVLAEDGRKMSKRLKNYPDPEEIFEKFGADALRIYLLQSAAVRGEDLRFSEIGLKEMTRKVMLPYWNAYFFLSTYAAVDGWDPAKDYTETREHRMDRWITIKLSSLKKQLQEEMEAYHLSKSISPLLSFLDDLTNWYIRRSRRRFWKSENDQEKLQAYSTLYEVLVEFSKLTAPFIPFLSEHIYSKLCLGHPLTAKDSVHLEDYPLPRSLSMKEEELEKGMDLTRAIVSLGRELREKLRIRIRQPLSTLYVGVAHPEDEARLVTLLDVVQEELNVRNVEFLPFKKIATWEVKPNFRLLGQKLGARLKDFQRECRHLTDEHVFCLLDGKTSTLCGEDFDKEAFMISLRPLESFDHPTHSSGSLVIGLNTEITQELKWEGYARELVNRVQRYRKDCNLEVDDRIELYAETKGDLTRAFSTCRDLIERETLSSLKLETPPSSARSQEENIDGQAVRIGISKR